MDMSTAEYVRLHLTRIGTHSLSSGIDTAENIIKAAMEGMNMECNFPAFATSFAVVSHIPKLLPHILIPFLLAGSSDEETQTSV